MDLLHPLTTLEWEESGELPDAENLYGQAVFLNGCIYIGISLWESPRYIFNQQQIPAKKPRVYCLSTDLTSCKEVAVPSTESFALAAYQSQLVLIGGRSVATKSTVNTVNWVTLAGEKQKKLEPLPPMPTSRCDCTAFTIGTPEYLIVAGGVGTASKPVDVVEVLVKNQWYSLRSLPRPCCQVKVAFHYGIVYLTGGLGSYYCQVFCRLEALKAACAKVSNGKLDDSGYWQPFDSSNRIYSPASYGSWLVDVGGQLIKVSKILAFSLLTKLWVHIGDLPCNMSFITTLVTPSGELMVFGRAADSVHGLRAMKASLAISSFPEGKFSLSAICKLDMAGIQVIKAIRQDTERFLEAAQIDTTTSHTAYTAWHSEAFTWENHLSEWITGNGPRAPTWKSLVEVLREMGEDLLSRQMEKYLNSINLKSLRELCISAIMSALLEQRSLHHDDLQARLPGYVPTVVRHSIIHTFKAHTHAL